LFYANAKQIAGQGLVTSDGELWLKQRRMIQPHLHRKQLGNLFDEMVDATATILERWETLAASGQEVELGEEMARITIQVITQTMFGKDSLAPAEIKETAIRAQRLIEYLGRSIFTSFLPIWIPLPERKQFQEDLRVFEPKVRQMIQHCRENPDGSASLIQMLLNTVDAETNTQMSEQQLYDEVVTIFAAGYETTATVLTWLGVVLDEHPEVLSQLQQEIDEVVGSRTPAFEDIPRLTYTRQVFMELMRKYTTVPFLPRALNEADTIGAFHLPANALVLVFYHGVHHNPEVWDTPDTFDPSRFAPEKMAHKHPFAYVPFSAGPRKCAGDEFAMMEGVLVTAMILQRFNLKLAPNQTFEARLGATMRPVNGVKVQFEKR
jgi:cytochrome P450